MRRCCYVLAALSMAVAAAWAAEKGDADRGMRAYVQSCSACHSIRPGVHERGPSLARVLGRTAGSVRGYRYSDTLKEEDFVWSEATLFEYLSVPTQTGGGDEALVHGVSMDFDALDAKTAEDMIAFLKRL